tara:strand:- start:483 stop:1022 length:540 start_codon:yes stop_codon:yes gene_type:complete
MLIDKTHSKKDIVGLFRKLGVIIDEELTKGKIVSNLEYYFKDVKYNDKITNLTELKDYLKNPSKKQRPTTQQKKDIMFKAKKIIKWAKNDYIFDMVTYKNAEDPYKDIMSIYMWGDLPSVRRACRLYNLSAYCQNNVNPIITEDVEEELNNNKIIKQQIIYKLSIRRATKEKPIIVVFD